MNANIEGKKVLITGGAGFIGSNLAIHLVKLNAQVTVLDSFNSLCGGNDFNLSPVAQRIQLIRGDIAQAAESLGDQTFHYIFNLAGNISHLDSMIHPHQDLSMNVMGHLGFLEFVRKNNLGAKIVFASTRQVYGQPRFNPVDESHPIAPPDINGIHKFCAEEYHRVFHQVYGLKAVVLRLSNTYGPRQLIRHDRQGVTGAFFGNAVRGESLKLFSGGSQTRDFSYVQDVVDAFLLAATKEECVGKIFNLSGESASLSEFAHLLAQISKVDCVSTEFPADRKAVDIGNIQTSSQAFRELTGWNPAVSLKEGVGQTFHFFSENKEHYL